MGGVRTGAVKKIARRIDGALAAASGTATIAQTFLRAFLAGNDDEFQPRGLDKDSGFQALLVTPEGRLWYVDEHGKSPLDCEFAACGSAHDVMVGAMAHGASAQEAVAIAIQYDVRCGGEVQMERL